MDGSSALYDAKRFFAYAILGLSASLLFALLCHLQIRRLSTAVCVLVCAYAVASMGLTIHYYRAEFGNDGRVSHEMYEVSQRIEVGDDQYRYALAENRLTLPGGVPGSSSFTTTVSEALFRVDELLNNKNAVMHAVKDASPGLGQALGERYLVYKNGEPVGITHILEKNAEANYVPVPMDGTARSLVQTIRLKNGATYEVYECAACPIGYAVDSYLTKEEFQALPKEQQGRAFLQTIPLETEVRSRVGESLSHADVKALDLAGSIDDLVEAAAKRPVSNFTRDVRGFSCEASGGTYFFSVPNDPGWTLTVDGGDASIIDACGFMLVNVPEGEHKLRFTYETPGLGLGLLISACAWIVFLVATVVSRRVTPSRSRLWVPDKVLRAFGGQL